MTKFLNISTDNTLGGSSASDETVSSQKAVKEYIDSKAPEIDGISITQNSDDELQTIGVIDQNNTSNAIKTWSGTKAQYNAIVTKDSNTLYNITDDTTLLLSVPNLFDFKWADHELNSQCWLRADTYSWQDGTVYSDAYNHLVADISGKTASTETINGTTVTYYLADDGHKIVKVAKVSAVETVYSSTGVAWYYILDTTNQRFKLPRTKYGFTGLRDSVGKYVPESLPNITGDIIPTSSYSGVVANGAFYGTTRSASTVTSAGSAGDRTIVGMDASRSSSTYKNNAPVQQRATQMYLYFYIGQYSQSATEQTAGLNTELFNGKADRDLNNAVVSSSFGTKLNSAGIRYVKEVYSSGTSWYRLYSDGWVEQGGDAYVNNANVWVNFLVQMADTNYYCGCKNITNNSYNANASMENPATTGIYVRSVNNCNWRWMVAGQGA